MQRPRVQRSALCQDPAASWYGAILPHQHANHLIISCFGTTSIRLPALPPPLPQPDADPHRDLLLQGHGGGPLAVPVRRVRSGQHLWGAALHGWVVTLGGDMRRWGRWRILPLAKRAAFAAERAGAFLAVVGEWCQAFKLDLPAPAFPPTPQAPPLLCTTAVPQATPQISSSPRCARVTARARPGF